MHAIARSDQIVSFAVRTSPPSHQLGRALENRAANARAVLQMGFGDQVASLQIRDLWSACCELLLSAALVRERKLDRFILDVEEVFDVAYDGDTLLCIFSAEHVFPVGAETFARALERIVADVMAGTSCPKVMEIAAAWGASQIRALPYSARFSDSLLM